MPPLSRLRLPILGLAALLTFSACDSADPIAPSASVDAVIAARSDLSVLSTALAATNLDAALRSPSEQYTVFAPTDAAFTALLGALGISAEQLLALDGIDGVLLYHVVPGTVRAADLSVGQSVTTARGEGAATFTVVAVPGGLGLDVNGDGQADARIIATDINASNGVVHVIDAVLVPTDFGDDTPQENLAEVVSGRDDLTVLTTALGATGLDAALSGDGEYTVFAPTDAAFTALLGALGISAEQLLGLDGIDGVLLYHVVEGTVLAGDLSAGQEVTTLRSNGENAFTVVAAGSGFGLDVSGNGQADALITTTDLRASNGVVHVIDAVLVPTDFMDNGDD